MKNLTGTPVFKDATLEQFIREKINKPEGEITSEDMAGIESLWSHKTFREVSDISGIEYCVNLKSISIDMQKINDLTRLKDLTSLKTLNLSFLTESPSPLVIDFSPLEGLPNLTELFTDLNQNSDFTSLAALPNLNNIKLCIEIKDARDLSQLSNLVNAERLHIDFYESDISDLTPLSSLINLKYLQLWCQHNINKHIINDLSPLSMLSKLEEFIILYNDDIDISPVAHVKNVRVGEIKIPFPVVKNKDPIPKASILPGVPVFKDAVFEKAIRDAIDKPEGEITSGDMAEIEKLSLRGLVGVGASHLELYDLSGIEYCVNLKHMSLSYVNRDSSFIFDISFLRSLKNLRTLGLHSERVVDISPLSELTNLTNLFIDLNMEVTDISPLSGLTELTQLVLIQSGVKDLSPLKGLSKLEELWLVGSEKDYSSVAHVKNITNIGRDLFHMESLWEQLS